jgi:hypothetical protein
VPDTQLSKQDINGTDLQTSPPASVAQIGGLNVVLPIRTDKWQSCEPID